MSATVNIAELPPDARARVLKQIEGTEHSASDPVNIPHGTFDDAVKKLKELQQQITLHSKAWNKGKLEAGEILLGLRKAAPHGTWEPQLAKICKAAKIGRTTAHRYMDLAEGKAVFQHEVVSKNGYALDELRSYLHKSLRRCDEDAACDASWSLA